jgi:hypothetical protein
MLIYAIVGAAVGYLWAVFYWAFAIPMHPAMAAIVVFPLAEETIRVCALRWALASRSPQLTQQGVLSGLAFGLGFGLSEASLRWWDALSANSGGTFLSYVGPIAPVLVHVALSIVVWRYLIEKRLLAGFSIAVILHATYNGYIWFVVRGIDVEYFALEFYARIILMGIAVATIVVALRRTALKVDRKG